MNTYETQYALFDIVNYVILILFVVSYVGMWRVAPTYLSILRLIMHTYSSLFLIIRFNPFVKRANFSDLDRKVVYSAGLFLLTTSAMTIYYSYLKNL